MTKLFLRMPPGCRFSFLRLALAAAFLAFPFCHALAQQKPITILITASRFAETADQALAPVSVITREDIERMQASTLEDALRAVPGLSLSNSGGAGQPVSLFLRGAESNHVLVLIDGVKAGSATSGTTPFEGLPLEQIEKIEVVRGPRSSLYGSEAIGGVIQVFTRRGRGEQSSARISGGSHGARGASMNVSGGDARAWYHLGASASATDGFNACRGSQTPFAGCFLPEDALEGDRDGHENRALSFRAGMPAGARISLEGGFLHSDNENEFDGAKQNESRTGARAAGIKASMRAAKYWRSSLSLGQSRDLADNFKDGAYRSTFDTVRNQANWQNDFSRGAAHRIIAGVDYLDDRVNSSDDYAARSRANTGVFASWRIAAGAHDWELSLRADDNEQFGGKTTGGIGWGKNLGAQTRATMSYGSAFTAPTFNDLYSRGDFYSGNPDLLPEKSRSIDFGLARNAGGGNRFALNIFHTVIDGLIALNQDFSTSVNIAEAQNTGIEFAAGMRGALWEWGASFTEQQPKDRSRSNNGKLLPRRARRILHLDITRKLGRHEFGASLHSQSGSYDDPANTRRMDGFAVVDARGARRFGDWTLEAKIRNIFDEEYETVAYYPQDGANFTLTLRHASR